MIIAEALLWVVLAVVLVPLAVLVVETVAALLPRRRSFADQAGPRPSCAVLIPAHDEEAGIGRTLAGVLAQLRPGDRLLVVADNCSDRTAAAAGWLVGGTAGPIVVLAGGGTLAALAGFAAWFRFGRSSLPVASLLAAPLYVLGKVPIYLAFLFRRQKAWVRTERVAPSPASRPRSLTIDPPSG